MKNSKYKKTIKCGLKKSNSSLYRNDQTEFKSKVYVNKQTTDAKKSINKKRTRNETENYFKKEDTFLVNTLLEQYFLCSL